MEGEKKKYTLWDNLCYSFACFKKWHPITPVFGILTAAGQCASLYIWLYAVKWIIDVVEKSENPAAEVNRVLMWIVIFSTVELILLVISTKSQKASAWRQTDTRYSLMLIWLLKVWTIPYAEIEKPETEYLVARSRVAVRNDVQGIPGLYYYVNRGLADIFKSVIGIVLVAFLNPIISIIIIAVFVVKIRLDREVTEYEKTLLWEGTAKERNEYEIIIQQLSNYGYGKDIRLYRLQSPMLERLGVLRKHVFNKNCEFQNKWMKFLLVGNVMELVEEVLTYGWLIYLVYIHRITIGDFTLYLGSIHSAISSLSILSEKVAGFIRCNAEIKVYREFMADDISNPYDEAEPKHTLEYDYKNYLETMHKVGQLKEWDVNAKYEIKFENVSYMYSGADRYALRNLNITMNPGEKLAIVGLNGAGKSTFVKLLCRLYEPTEGRILLNGKDIKEYDIDEYRKLIAPVFQDEETYAYSLAQNVSLKTKEKTDYKKAEDKIREADLGDKLDELPNGINTPLYKYLSSDGIDLSGGQKAKLMLARALYKNAPVIILDEPTAALDALAEEKSYLNFNRMAAGRTTVYISHRLSSTRFCDKVAMFDNGSLIEYGTHEELLEKKGKYSEIFEVQAQYYKEHKEEEGMKNE